MGLGVASGRFRLQLCGLPIAVEQVSQAVRLFLRKQSYPSVLAGLKITQIRPLFAGAFIISKLTYPRPTAPSTKTLYTNLVHKY